MNNYRIIEYGSSDEVAIGIPCSVDYLERATRVVPTYLRRAKYPCKICLILDLCTPWLGANKACNYGIDNINTKYYLYTGVDYFPSIGYLKVAMNTIKETGKKVFCFNDGKWFGEHCSIALVDREYARSIYGSGLFYNGYYHGGADTEINIIYSKDNQVCYNPEAIIMEIDYEKSFDRTFWDGMDTKLFDTRMEVIKNDKIQSIEEPHL